MRHQRLDKRAANAVFAAVGFDRDVVDIALVEHEVHAYVADDLPVLERDIKERVFVIKLRLYALPRPRVSKAGVFYRAYAVKMGGGHSFNFHI